MQLVFSIGSQQGNTCFMLILKFMNI